MQKPLRSLPLSQMTITDGFWSRFQELVRTQVIPYQWKALNDQIEGAAPSYCMHNFRVAAGMETGTFGGHVFQDSDFAKWLEAVAYSLTWHPDPELERTADEAIDIVCAAQQPDGYLDTYYIINGLDKRFTNLMNNHELYCLGHFLEGAIAYYQATGKDKLLKALMRYVDLVQQCIGPQEGQLHGYPGHEVIELALVKLYQITQEERYLRLAKYFIDQRGQEPNYFRQEMQQNQNRWAWEKSYFQFQYYQAGKPVHQQDAAEGHAVRAVYLYSGMADVARETGDPTLMDACKALWDNLTEKRMYVTGGIGSSKYGEAFTFDYDLPNDTIYGETCASIGLVFFAQRMLELDPDGRYGDVMEKALYNGTISGMSLDGRSFFYVNPLEVLPEASLKDEGHSHVKVQRQKWFGCACCPPNLARLIASLGNYLYSVGEKDAKEILYQHLYTGSLLETQLDGKKVAIRTKTRYPWEETITFTLSIPEGTADFAYALRIPGWCREDSFSVTVNGKPLSLTPEKGYITLSGPFSDGDTVVLTLPMPVEMISAHPKVREDAGKVCITRGPVVYCLEQEDNGADLHRIYLTPDTAFTCQWEPQLLDGVVTLQCTALQRQEAQPDGALYRRYTPPTDLPKPLRWIPYYSWANRSPGEMCVWIKMKS